MIILPLQALQKTVPEFGGSAEHNLLVLPQEGDIGHVPKRRRVLHLPQPDFQVIETVIVLLCRQANQLMLRNQGLNQGAAGSIAPTCSANDLSEHIKGGLSCPVRAGIQAQIPVQHPNQGHIGDIQAFGNHLGADQHRDLFLPEPGKDLFVGIHSAYRVRVHSDGLHIRKQLRQLLLDPLGPGTDGLQRTAALGAAAGNRLRMAAIVAHKPVVGAVIGQPLAAPGAFRCFPAIHAHQRPGGAPPVQEQNRLLPGSMGIMDALPKGDAQRAVVSQLQLLTHIHQFYLGQRPAVISVFDGIEPVKALFRPVHTLY